MRIEPGFTLIEIIVVLAILGILMVTAYPSILNTTASRGLENSARDILSSCQAARYLAVSTKSPHRLAFSFARGRWFYGIEEKNPSGTWIAVTRYVPKEIPGQFAATIDLPGVLTVEYSTMGVISNFDSLHRTITLGSEKLRLNSAPDLRVLTFYAGGSVQFGISETS